MSKRKVTDPANDVAVFETPPAPEPTALVELYGSKEEWTPAPDTNLADCPTSIDTSSKDGKIKLFNALAEADIRMPRGGFVVLDVVDYLVHPARVVSRETGELIDSLRSVFFCRDGKRFATFSPVVADRLKQLVSLYGGERWDERVILKIEERTNRAGTSVYHSLTIATEDDLPCEES